MSATNYGGWELARYKELEVRLRRAIEITHKALRIRGAMETLKDGFGPTLVDPDFDWWATLDWLEQAQREIPRLYDASATAALLASRARYRNDGEAGAERQAVQATVEAVDARLTTISRQLNRFPLDVPGDFDAGRGWGNLPPAVAAPQPSDLVMGWIMSVSLEDSDDGYAALEAVGAALLGAMFCPGYGAAAEDEAWQAPVWEGIAACLATGVPLGGLRQLALEERSAGRGPAEDPDRWSRVFALLDEAPHGDAAQISGEAPGVPAEKAASDTAAGSTPMAKGVRIVRDLVPRGQRVLARFCPSPHESLAMTQGSSPASPAATPGAPYGSPRTQVAPTLLSLGWRLTAIRRLGFACNEIFGQVGREFDYRDARLLRSLGPVLTEVDELAKNSGEVVLPPDVASVLDALLALLTHELTSPAMRAQWMRDVSVVCDQLDEQLDQTLGELRSALMVTLTRAQLPLDAVKEGYRYVRGIPSPAYPWQQPLSGELIRKQVVSLVTAVDGALMPLLGRHPRHAWAGGKPAGRVVDLNLALQNLGDRLRGHWQRRIQQSGLLQAWPDFFREVGDVETAGKLLSQLLNGNAFVGVAVDPVELADALAKGQLPKVLADVMVVAKATDARSMLIFGPASVGKSTGFIEPVLVQALLAEEQVMYFVKRTEFIESVYPLAVLLLGEHRVNVLDLSSTGLVVKKSRGEEWHGTAWYPLAECVDYEQAKSLARMLMGERSSIRQDFKGQGGVWYGSIPEAVFAMAAYVVAMWERPDIGWNFRHDGRSGLNLVREFFGVPGKVPGIRAATLADDERLRNETQPWFDDDFARRWTEAYDQAWEAARSVHAYLADIAWLAKFMEVMGWPVHPAVLLSLDGQPSSELQGVDVKAWRADTSDSATPGMMELALRDLPVHECEAASPRPGQPYVTAQQLASGDGGLLFVVNSTTKQNRGLVMEALVERALACRDVVAARYAKVRLSTGHDGKLGTLTTIFDEFDLVVPGVLEVAEVQRGQGVRVIAAALNLAQIELDLGPTEARALVGAVPYKFFISDDPGNLTELCATWGRTVKTIRGVSYSEGRGLGGGHSTHERSSTEYETTRVTAEMLVNVPRGYGILRCAIPIKTTNRDGKPEHRRVLLFRMPHPDEPGAPVTDLLAWADALAAERPGLKPPWHRWDPDLEQIEVAPEPRKRPFGARSGGGSGGGLRGASLTASPGSTTPWSPASDATQRPGGPRPGTTSEQ